VLKPTERARIYDICEESAKRKLRHKTEEVTRGQRKLLFFQQVEQRGGESFTDTMRLLRSIK
jgi:hypothetical protein